VDAFVHPGIHLEEQSQNSAAYALFERAIQARPKCALGYLFAGLGEESIVEQSACDAESKMHNALSLDPSVGKDPGFFKRHLRSVTGSSSAEAGPPAVTTDLYATANRFRVGVGVGLLIAAPFVYLARRGRRISG
jgi:hypothetical protein